MSVLRKILGLSREDKRRNADIRKLLNIDKDIVEVIQKRRLSYFNHVARMNSERCTYVVLHGYVDGTRQKKRSRRRWLDNIREDCEETSGLISLTILGTACLAFHLCRAAVK